MANFAGDEEPRGVVLAPGYRERAAGVRAAVQAEEVKRTEKTLAKARTKDSMAAFSKLTHVVDGQARIVDQSPLIVPIDQLAEGAERDELFEAAPRADARLPRDARVRPARAARAVRADRLRAQGGRRGQRRHARVDRAAARPRRRGPAVPADEGGRGVGARGVPRPQRVLEPRRASGRRTAADAGDQRHLPRLAARRRRARRRSRATSTAGSSRTGRAPRRSSRWSRRAWPRTAGSAAGRWPARTPAAATAIAIAAYLGNGDSFDRAILEFSRAPTPTRTSATTRRCADAAKSGRIEVQEGL